MKATVKATLGKELYYTEVIAGSNVLITDEPEAKGGGNKGFNPFEIMATALASCTAATLKMYLDTKKWEVDKINVEVVAEQDKETNTTTFNRVVTFEGDNLTEENKKRLLIVANKCPMHNVLMGEIIINTDLE